MSQAGDIRGDIDNFLNTLQTYSELEEYRIKLIKYINERCRLIAEEAGIKTVIDTVGAKRALETSYYYEE